MAQLQNDLNEFVALLNSHKVEYLVVGECELERNSGRVAVQQERADRRASLAADVQGIAESQDRARQSSSSVATSRAAASIRGSSAVGTSHATPSK